jgi:Domain of unknown function (DUF4836)
MKSKTTKRNTVTNPTHSGITHSHPVRRLILLAIAALISIQSFAQDNPLFRNIPPGATAVYQVNIPVITAKLSWSEIMATIPSSRLSAHNSPMLEMLKDPAKSGIDLSKDIFVTQEKNDSWDSTGTLTLLLHLQDSGKFIAYVRMLAPNLRTFNIPNKEKARVVGKDVTAIAWTKTLGVVVFITPPAREAFEKLKHYQDGKTDQNGAKAPPAGQGHPAAALHNYALVAAKKGLLAISGFDNSFYTTDPIFKAGFSDDADIHIWTDQGKGLSMLLNTLLKSKVPLQSLLQGDGKAFGASGARGKKTLASIRFEPGKVVMKSSNILTPENAAFTAKMFGRPLNTDLVASIPKGNLLGLVNIHFDPTAINDVLDKAGVRKKVDSILATKNLSLDTVLQAFKGDFQLAVLEPEMSDSTQKPKFPLYFAVTINDLSAFAKIAAVVKAIKDSAAVDPATGTTRNILGGMKMASTLQGNLLVISTTKEYADGWFSNTEKRSTGFLTDRMKNNAFCLLIDFKTLAHFVEGLSSDKDPSGKAKQMLGLIHKFDQLTITGGAIKDGKSESVTELQLTDTSTNSLVQLSRLFHM